MSNTSLRYHLVLEQPAPIEIYSLSLHDALPILKKPPRFGGMKTYNWEGVNPDGYFLDKLEPIPSGLTPSRSEERFSRNAETDLVCRLLLEKKKKCKYRNGVAARFSADVRSARRET